MIKKKFVSILFCVSAGANLENLGSDEHEIIDLCNIIVDLNKLQSISVSHYFLRTKTHSTISDECASLTGYTEKIFENSIYLEEFINEFDKHLLETHVHPDEMENDFVFVTDGPLHLKQALIPECNKKDIQLPNYYYEYYDLRKEYKRFANSTKMLTLHEICQCLQIPECSEGVYSLRMCKNIESVLLLMLKNSHLLGEQENIYRECDYGICPSDDQVEENTVVRVRGLPWQCTDRDVDRFFSGLNIVEGGIALCLSTQGRRNGEALVRFVDEQERNLALRRHKHHIGQRYIEVYRATSKDFLSIAGGSNLEAKTFLSRNGKVIIRMRGLPFDSGAKDVVEFFKRGSNQCEVIDDEEGVLFVHYPDGRATGDAFVMVKSDEEATRALLKHKEMIGTRYIELFRSTSAEVIQVFKRSQDPKFSQNLNLKDQHAISPMPILPPEMMSGENRKDCIRLRNLPVECGVEQILEFLGVHSQHILPQGVHMILNSQGQPAGEAFIQLDAEQSAFNVCNHKNGKFMYLSGKKFHIEVLQCSGEEMNLVLLGLLPSNLTNFQQPLTSSFKAQRARIPANSITNTANYSPYFIMGSEHPTAHHHTFQLPVASGVATNVPATNLMYHAANVNGAAGGLDTTAVNPNLIKTLSSPSGTPTAFVKSPSGMTALTTPTSPLITQSLQFANPHQYSPILWYYPTTTNPTSAATSTLFYQTPAPPGPAPAYVTPHHHTLQTTGAPCILILKNAPYNVTVSDVLNFFSGYEIFPDSIQIQKNGAGSSDVIITLFNRNEAERAIVEKNHQKMAGHQIELYISI